MAHSLVSLLLASGSGVRLVEQQDRRQRTDRRRVWRGGRRAMDRVRDADNAASGTPGGFDKVRGDEDEGGSDSR